jgi:hypothetical protein
MRDHIDRIVSVVLVALEIVVGHGQAPAELLNEYLMPIVRERCVDALG